MSIPVLLVDDHTVVREGLRHILEESGDIVCSQAASAEEALQMLGSGHLARVILLDITLPGMSGLDALREIRERYPNAAVLMLSMHPEERYAIRAMRMGAIGYLCKSTPTQEMLSAIHKAIQGKSNFSSSTFNSPSQPLHANLSAREFQVLCMLGSGKPPSEIGRELNLSVKTVSTHRERILRKMEFSSNLEIMRYVLKEGLVGAE